MAALLTSVAGNKDKLAIYLSDCRKLNLRVMPPSINDSTEDFTVIDSSTIVFGLAAINGIGYAVSEAILSNRDLNKPYTSMHDFLRRTNPAVLKKGTLEHLAASGAFDELIDRTLDQDFGRRTELSILEREKEELGIYVSKNPVDGIWDLLSESISHEIVELQDVNAGSRVSISGIISSFKKIITKKGSRMYKFNVQDISSDIEVIVFPRESKNYDEDFFSNGEVVNIVGTLNKEGDEENSTNKIVLNSCEKVDLSYFSGGRPIYLTSNKLITEKTINKLYAIINENTGGSYVFVDINDGDKNLKFKFNKTTSIVIKDKLEELIKEIQ
jgi:DNA polymerase-3 subunit alpha